MATNGVILRLLRILLPHFVHDGHRGSGRDHVISSLLQYRQAYSGGHVLQVSINATDTVDIADIATALSRPRIVARLQNSVGCPSGDGLATTRGHDRHRRLHREGRPIGEEIDVVDYVRRGNNVGRRCHQAAPTLWAGGHDNDLVTGMAGACVGRDGASVGAAAAAGPCPPSS